MLWQTRNDWKLPDDGTTGRRDNSGPMCSAACGNRHAPPAMAFIPEARTEASPKFDEADPLFLKKNKAKEQKQKPTRSKCSLLGPMRVRVFGNIPTTGCFQPADVEAWMVFCFPLLSRDFDEEIPGGSNWGRNWGRRFFRPKRTKIAFLFVISG